MSESPFRLHVIIVSLGFFGIFMGFNTAQALATSLNASLANACLGTLYGTFALSCIFAPKFIAYLGPKLSMILGSVPYILMVLSFLKPCYALSLPAHFLVGLGAPFLWTGSAVYISRAAFKRSGLLNESVEKSTSYFNGLFFTIFNINGLTGLILSSIILSNAGDDAKKYLFIVLSAVGGLGTLTLSFVPSVDSTEPAFSEAYIALNEDVPPTTTTEVNEISLVETLKLSFTSPRLTLMLPCIFYNGLSLAFMLGDYSKYIITNSLGLKFCGYVLGTYYACNTIFSYVAGKVAAKPIIRRNILLAAAGVHVLFFTLVYFINFHVNYKTVTINGKDKEIRLQHPDTIEYFNVFITTILFSFGDAILQSQPPAILQSFYSGTPQDSDSAMSAYKLFQSLGLGIQFVMGMFLTNMDHKIYILVGVEIVAIICLIQLRSKYMTEEAEMGSGGQNMYPELQ